MQTKKTMGLGVCALGLLFSSLSLAKSPVYKVTKGDDHVYIGGTIHLLSESDYPLPSAFNQAFDGSEHIYFETDTSQGSSPEMQDKMGEMMALPEGETLKMQLNEKTYNRLERFLLERQLPIELFQTITPSAVSISLTVIELQRLGLGDAKSGVDQFYSSKTKEAGKDPFYLESLEEQISFLGQFNQADPNLIINANLDDLSKLTTNWKTAVKAWREGDLATMGESLGGSSLQTDFPAIYQVLLTDRNNRWLEKIETMFESKEIELVLVGALHLVNKEGLIEQLQKRGYDVEQLD